jgi:predicted dinucleotide-binding enzyme
MASEPIRISVLGAGNIGGTLGRKWSAANHKVAFGVNDPQGKNAQALRSELGEKVAIGTLADALNSDPQVVVFAVPGAIMDSVITTYAAQLDGRIVVDIANRLGGSPTDSANRRGSNPLNSLATFQEHTPHAQVFRAFNSLGWENFADPLYDGVPADLFYCGPGGEPRSVMERLIADVGLRPVYAGGLEHIGAVDAVASLWFALAFDQKKGRNIAFKMLSR